MPTYDYCCRSCRVYIEDVVHKLDEDPEILCPECGERMTRAVGQCNFAVKGFSLRKRRRELESRFRKREQRDDWKNLSDRDKWKMSEIARKYGSGVPWTHDPKDGQSKKKVNRDEEAKKKEEKELNKRKGIRRAEFTD